MKKRIVALILVIATSLLTLAGCFGSYDMAREEYVGNYATFDAKAFDAGIKNIKIKDGTFTTDEATRIEKTAAEIYKIVTDAMIANVTDDDKKYEGKLDASDVLYFVYYAVDENEGTEEAPNANKGNVYFTVDMKESALTSSTSSKNHVIKLSGDYTAKDSKFIKALQDNLKLEGIEDIKDYVFKMDTDVASASDYKPAAGDTLYIKFTRSYVKTTPATEEGEAAKTETITESAAYHKITLEAGKPLDDKLLLGKEEYSKEFKITENDIEYTYKSVEVLGKIETQGQAIATFKYTPYTTSNSVLPDNLRASTAKVELKDVELTYYVYPVYYLDCKKAPTATEVEAGSADYSIVADILADVYNSKLTADSFKALADEGYKSADESNTDTIADILADIAALYTPVVDTADETKTGEFYKKDSELRKLYDTYTAKKAISDKSDATTAQKTETTDAQKALTNAQNKVLDGLVAKIMNYVKDDNGTKTLITAEIYKQYLEDNYYKLATAYNEYVIEEVQTAVWKLIDSTVKVTGYPEKLLKEFTDHIYEELEYQYYTGSQSSGQKLAFREAYKTVEEFARSTDGKTFLANTKSSITSDQSFDQILEAEAKSYLNDIIKVFVVSQHVEAAAKAAMPGFIESDMKVGKYDAHIHLDEYIESYGEKDGQKKYDEALEQTEEYKQFVKDTAENFIIDDDYLKAYKKYVGTSSYKLKLEQYGETNFRTAVQFANLFDYLTSMELIEKDEDRHEETNQPAYTAADENGNIYLAFRVVKYSIEAETEENK